jgi:hypothetical protein
MKFPPPQPGASPIYVTRDAVIDFNFHLSATSPDRQAQQALEALLATYRNRSNPGHFAMTSEFGALHIKPSAAPTAYGELRSSESPLDRSISWAALVATGTNSFQGVLAAISKQTGRTIWLGQPNVRIPAKLSEATVPSGGHATGRAILTAAVRSLGPQVTWHLYCQPGQDACAFNIIHW